MRLMMSVLASLAGVALVQGHAKAQVVATASFERGPRFLLARDSEVVPVDVSKTPVLARRLNLDLEGATLKDALTEIESQSGLRLAYSDDAVPLEKRVHLRAEAITAAAALTDVLFDAGVDVVFKPDGSAALVKRPAAPPTGSITGNVTNAQSGDPVEGVEVFLQETRWRTLTGTDGQYRLVDVDTGTYVVTARRIGYTGQSRSVTVTEGQEATADFALQPAATKLGDVVVTAQKREERLQDVPMSIAVVTLEEIDRRGLVSAEDYLRGIPGANQTTDQRGQSIVVRGIETSTGAQNFQSGTTVATYFGETPTTNSAGLSGNTNVDLKLVDIERVEVLRGPQGTAFGNSSMGGTVRTIPIAPKLERLEGKLGVGYSATSGTGGDNYNIQAVGNFPLIKDKLALRATGYRYEDSGFYRNVAGSDPTFQSAVVAPYGAQAFATDEDEVGASRFTGGRIAGLFQASDALKVTLSYLTQKTEVDGRAFTRTATYDQVVLQVAPENVIRGQTGGIFDTDIDLANATMEYNLGWANLLATYSYTNSGSLSSLPWTSLAAPLPWPVSVSSTGKHREHVGEIRLTTQLDGAWNFLGGLYAEDLEDEFINDNYWYGSPDSNFFAPGERFLGVLRDRRNLKQKAAFAEASWEFLPGFTLTGGVRAYDYERTGREVGSGFFYGETVRTMGTDASGTNFRGNLSHKLNDNALVYAGWSQGFRLGKPQAGLPPGVCDGDSDGIVDGTANITIEQTKILNPDNVDNYEIGGKFMLLDRRLMIAADVYRMDWYGLPVTVLAPFAPGCGIAYVANAGAARSEGIEFQANFYVTQAFRVDIGGSLIHARLTEDVPALGAVAGNSLPGSPKVNANLGLQYELAIGGHKSFVRADAIYIGPLYGDLQGSAFVRAGGYVNVDASARVALRYLDVGLFVRNLTDRNDFTLRTGKPLSPFYGYRLRPRTIGLQVGRNF